MLQEDLTWDPIYITRPVSSINRIYVLFLLIALVTAAARLVRLWIAAPPFRLSRQITNAGYMRRLELARSRTIQWMGCVILGWCAVFFIEVTRQCESLLAAKIMTPVPVLGAIQDLAMLAGVAFFTALLLFIAQWHLLVRLQYLRKRSSST